MTVPNETSKAGPYLGNGVTKAFGFGFLVISASHVRVVKTFADGAYADLVFGADYLVSGAGNPAGGNVTLDVAPATGETITILRDLPFTQETDLENQGAFHAQTIEDALDLSVMRDQILFGRLRNSIHVPDTETADMELPPAALRANKYMLFDANGEPTYVNSQIDARYYGAAAVDPVLRPDGSPRQASDLYFNTTGFKFRVFTGTAWTDALPTANLTLVNYREVSATAKTTFTIAGGYQTGAVFVYLNGVLLDTSEYTASNGTTVVLASACAINDELRCVSFSNFSVADTLARSNNLSDLPSASAALTSLGFTALAKTLAAVLDAASYRAAIGALGVGGVSFGDLLPAAVVTSVEAIAANNNDTTLPTCAAVKGLVDTTALGVGQTWQVMTGSRAVNTVYQNTTGRPIAVWVSADASSTSRTFEVSVDGTTWVIVGAFIENSTYPSISFTVVPPGHYYRVNGAATLYTWSELR